MRTIFVNAPYGRYDMGRYGFPARHPTLPIRLGQRREYAFNIVEDVLQAVGIDESDVTRLIDSLPIANQGAYRDKLAGCRAMGYTTVPGAKCLYDLFQELKDVLENKRPAAAPVPVLRPQPSGGFPILPVALGGLAAAALVYVLATR